MQRAMAAVNQTPTTVKQGASPVRRLESSKIDSTHRSVDKPSPITSPKLQSNTFDSKIN